MSSCFYTRVLMAGYACFHATDCVSCCRWDSRGSVKLKTPFLLNMKHQVSSVQILHHKEQMLLLTSVSVEVTVPTEGVE